MNHDIEKKQKKIRDKKIKPVRKKKERKSKGALIAIIIVIIVAVIALAAGLGSYFFLNNRTAVQEEVSVSVEELQQEQTKEEKEAEEPEKDKIGSGVLSHIMTAGNAVESAYNSRPKSYELTQENAEYLPKIDSCLIQPETGKVEVTIKGEGIPASDDKYLYLFSLDTFDTEISESDEYITKVYKDTEVTMSAALNHNSASSRLYDKFVVAVKKDDTFVQVGSSRYITNPEAIARYGGVFHTPASKKGILIDPNRLRGGELDDLGVKQAAYNIPVARLLGQSTSSLYPTIYYTYNGKTYPINGQIVAEYDLVFGTLTAKGISTTAILLNNYSGAYPQLIHPQARSGSTAPYYMFNAADESGVEYLAAIGTFLANRYSGSEHGRVSCWVIANEINARKEWNYMAHTDIQTYVDEYAKAFRVFYTAIKSVSSSARIYMPIDQQWDRNIKGNTNYDGRDIVDEFNRNISAKGNIDWGLSQHPYNVPLTEPRIWKSTNYVKHSVNTSMITMDNIEILTNYMQQEQLLTDDGQVRSIILSEQGYTASQGEGLQAAAFAYAYYKAEANPHIDSFLLNRQTDAPEEVAQGLAFGLNTVGGQRRQLYNVFKYIDTPQHAQYTDFAKSIIGITNWSEIY